MIPLLSTPPPLRGGGRILDVFQLSVSRRLFHCLPNPCAPNVSSRVLPDRCLLPDCSPWKNTLTALHWRTTSAAGWENRSLGLCGRDMTWVLCGQDREKDVRVMKQLISRYQCQNTERKINHPCVIHWEHQGHRKNICLLHLFNLLSSISSVLFLLLHNLICCHNRTCFSYCKHITLVTFLYTCHDYIYHDFIYIFTPCAIHLAVYLILCHLIMLIGVDV